MSRWRQVFGGALLALGALASAVPLDAQEPYTVFGRVRDAASGDPLPGAQVSIQGTQYGGLTDAEGSFAIIAPLSPGEYVVEAVLIGRERQTRSVTLAADRLVRVPDFHLLEQALSLEAVIVTGTAAPTTRRALGNSVSTVQGEQLTESTATTVDQALQGKIAGASITSNTGTPGGGVSVRLRGTSSIVGGAEPLYIVDGVIVDNNADQQINLGYRSNTSNRLADLAPQDIARVEILKGAAAAALYGSRANNGVVQIFTKRGREGAPRVTVGSSVRLSQLENEIDFALTPLGIDGNPVQRFDHQDLVFRDGWGNDAYASVAGGVEDTRYFLSANWVSDEGIMRGSANEKLNARLNLDQRLTDWLELSAGANYIRNHTDLLINGEQGSGGILTAIAFTRTDVDLAERDPDTGKLLNRAFVFPNPLEVIEDWATPQDVNRFVGSFQAKVNPLERLGLDYRLGYDHYEMETALFIPRGVSAAGGLGSASSINRRNMLINNDLVGSYEFGVGESLDLTTSLGMNHTYQRAQNLNLSASDLTPLTQLVRGAVQSASEGEVEAVTLGFFGQQLVGWNDRLFLTGALRLDASSTFGADERWQLYPKVSGSWVVSEEPFWGGTPMGGWFSSLRLRAALGYAGNQPPLQYAYARIPRFGSVINIDRLGLVPNSLAGNPDLKPERQREFELGFDASFIEDRVGLVFTYYNQYTDDLLLERPFAPSVGFGSILTNIGALSNRGIELELRTSNIVRENFGWSSSLIYSNNRNRVEELFGDPYTVGYTNRVQEGQPLGVHRMSAFERDASGNIVFDADGLPVRSDTLRIVGDPWPDFNLSLGNDFRLGDSWSASILFDGQFGHDLWNQTQRIMDIFQAGPLFDAVLRGEITQAERARRQGIWEHYLEDASYVKLRDLSIRYNTEGALAEWLRVRDVQFELLGRNLFTWTDYTGYDPEINMFGLNTVERGVDFAVYPNPRTVSLGVRLSY